MQRTDDMGVPVGFNQPCVRAPEPFSIFGSENPASEHGILCNNRQRSRQRLHIDVSKGLFGRHVKEQIRGSIHRWHVLKRQREQPPASWYREFRGTYHLGTHRPISDNEQEQVSHSPQKRDAIDDPFLRHKRPGHQHDCCIRRQPKRASVWFCAREFIYSYSVWDQRGIPLVSMPLIKLGIGADQTIAPKKKVLPAGSPRGPVSVLCDKDVRGCAISTVCAQPPVYKWVTASDGAVVIRS